MKRLLTVAAVTMVLLAGGTDAVAKVPGVGVEDTCACGGTVYVLWTLIYWPNGMTGEAWCERHWNNGNTTWTQCW